MVPVGGYLVVTGPLRFPYHADPIDTMYRPTAAEMIEEIGPEFAVVESEDILCERGARFYSFRPERSTPPHRTLADTVHPLRGVEGHGDVGLPTDVRLCRGGETRDVVSRRSR